MPIINIKLNIKKDAWNWWHACNSISHGVNWKLKVEKELRDKVYKKNEKEAFDFLIPYLEDYYKNRKIEGYIQKIQEGFLKRQNKIFEIMEKVSNRPIYRDNFTCFITSFPRFPYNYKKGYIWISAKKDIDYQVLIFIHELLHFQYFEYFGEKIWDKLGKEKHGRLKEAMTVILNDEFGEVTKEKDEGYDIDIGLRKVLLAYWKKSKDMDDFIKKAVNYLMITH